MERNKPSRYAREVGAETGRVPRHAGAIREALDALDSKPFPPTLPEFLAMCREAGHRHSAPVQALGYTPTAEEQARAAEVIAKAANRLTEIDRRDHKEWAKSLQSRHEAGERLSTQQINAYCEALGIKRTDMQEAA